MCLLVLDRRSSLNILSSNKQSSDNNWHSYLIITNELTVIVAVCRCGHKEAVFFQSHSMKAQVMIQWALVWILLTVHDNSKVLTQIVLVLFFNRMLWGSTTCAQRLTVDTDGRNKDWLCRHLHYICSFQIQSTSAAQTSKTVGMMTCGSSDIIL